MQKPDFKGLKKLIKAIEDTDAVFKRMYADRELQEGNIKAACGRIAAKNARKQLDDYSIDELKNARAGIRVQAISAAGYKTLGDLAKLSDYELLSIEGIGEKQAEAIKNIITEFANSLSSRVTVTLDAYGKDKDDENNKALITELGRYINTEAVRRDARESAEKLDNFCCWLRGEKFIKNSVRWLFSGSELKEHTLEIADEIYSFCTGDFFNGLLQVIDVYDKANKTTYEDAYASFVQNSAPFYALLEKAGSISGNKPFVYDSIPSQLAEEIEATELSDASFKGNLRGYQTFGAKYILHQKKVLLGDEMGLGKTIQAIAAMSHIHDTEGDGCHYLVVCPASVIVNWAREIMKFSNIKTHIIHGQGIDTAFDKWRSEGGAAITNYESMGKIIRGIDNHMHLSMLVIDEAHYIKNPDAQRTMYIRRLDNESERIVLMTGTPLENRVEEMCNLIDFVRPDMVKDVRALAHMTSLPEFREKLSPVYLRRTRKQVLTELPEIDEKQEWCEMTKSDADAYTSAVMGAGFPSMRRVSFLQDSLAESAKCGRLLELCSEAGDEGRKIVVFSYFKETIAKVGAALGDKCVGVISGDTKVELRQGIIDKFGSSPDGSVLLCQIQAGGVGLNIQAASIVIFCEPQIKPSLTWQALSRVYRMGQTRNVLVYHLLCPDTVDDYMIQLFEEKKIAFDSFADESAIASAYDNILDKEWIKGIVEAESKKYALACIE
ncbi:MAG: DEAD/DEAH box helicase [Butyrivibrio sp.]|nr:DEAD/DEAH box helicase [Butyrivibrio sp.]